MPLTSAAITALTVESAPRALWSEFLLSWFDGGSHTLDGQPAAVFPKATVAFDQALLRQPMDTGTAGEAPVNILVTTAGLRDRVMWQAGGQVAVSEVAWTFWVRCHLRDAAESRRVSQTAAELLRALLSSPADVYDLALKGVQHLRPRKPQRLTSETWEMYTMACAGRLQYERALTAV